MTGTAGSAARDMSHGGQGVRQQHLAAVQDDRAPDGYDQVARRDALRLAHRHLEVWRHDIFWYAAHPVGRWPWMTGARMDLRQVLNDAERIIALDETLRAVEARHPGWNVYLCPSRAMWHAWREGVHVAEPTVDAMAAAIAAVEAVTTWAPLATAV